MTSSHDGSPRADHAVFRLRAERMARSTRPYRARGSRTERCLHCRVAAAHCLCARRPQPTSSASFCLLMHGIEPLRTSNTGWLVADAVRDTHAFVWSRTAPDPRLLALLSDPALRPYVVFPSDGPDDPRAVRGVDSSDGRRPLFVLLDGTWAEARKMYRTSRWLDALPVLSLDRAAGAAYRLRCSGRASEMCTAEVAAHCMRLVGDATGAVALEQWLAEFVAVTMRMRGQSREGSDVSAEDDPHAAGD